MSAALTEALTRLAGDDPSLCHWLRWRVGDLEGENDCVVYAQRHRIPSREDWRIGEMTTQRLALEAVQAHNAILATVHRR